MDTVTIILTPIEASRFKLFQKYHEVFSHLEATEALKIGFGKVIMNFAFGELQNIVKEEVIYKK